MDTFERSAQKDIFVEDSDIVPIIVKYADFNVLRHNEKSDTAFNDAIKSYEGIHTCVFVNDGISKGKKARAQFLLILEDVGLSIRVQIDDFSRSFFGPTLLIEKPVIPSDENEFIRRRCEIRFIDKDTDEIDVASEMHWDDRLSELKTFIQSVASLKRPLKEIRKEEDQAIWSSYAEGLEALTKAKQELRKISKVGKIHTEKNRRKENVSVIDLEIESTTNAQDLEKSIYDALDGHVVKPRFETNKNGKECSIVYEGFRKFADDELIEFASIAEQSCYRMKTPQPLYMLKGGFSFKSSETDNEAIIAEFDTLLNDYDPEYPKKISRQYSFGSDSDASYVRDIIKQRFGNVLKCTPDTNLTISFIEDGQDNLLQSITELFPEITGIERGQFFVLKSKRPIDCNRLESMSLAFDSCRVKLNVTSFDPSVPVISTLISKNGAYYGIVHDKTKIDNQPKGWTFSVSKSYEKNGLKTRCSIFEYEYAFRKSVSKDVMKSIARLLGSESNIRINTAIGRAYCTPLDATDYQEIKDKIASAVPDNVQVVCPEYKPTLSLTFLNEDPEFKQESFATIESNLKDASCKWSINGDTLVFTVTLEDEDSRNKIVAKIQKVASDYSHVFDFSFENNNVNGTTTIIFSEDADLRAEYEKELQGDFGRQEVKLITSEYDEIQADLLEAMMEDNRAEISSLRKKERELLLRSEKIGTCTVRTRNTIKIEVCPSFIEKLENAEISIQNNDYIQFPLLGEAINIARQKDAMDRILKPGTKNKYGKIIPSAANPNLSNFLFDPRYASETVSDIEAVKEHIKERQIESNMNERQREAVAKAIEAQDIAFIQGPPGTGKTTVIAEIIWQEVLRNHSCKILLTSQTNTAVDNALERLQGKRGIRPIRIPKIDGEARMVREGKRYLLSQLQDWGEKSTEDNSDNAANIWVDTILKEMDSSDKYAQVIARWKQDLTEKDQFVRKTFAESYLRNVNLVAATCSICGSKSFGEVYNQLFGKHDMQFDVVIMDEASKATPLEMAIPMVLGKKIILIGDHKQLPPMVDDDEVKEAFRKIGRSDLVDKLENIKESQFKRLFEASQKMRQSLVSTLDTQYRMHKQIMNCITHFYKDDIEGGLKCGIESSMDSEDWNNRGSRYHGLENPPFINPDVHAIWVDVDGKEEMNGHSPYNRAELKAIEKILKTLRASEGYKEYTSHFSRPEDEEIGIITFYGAQVKELQKMYKEGKLGPGKYKIDVVDSFQGMERNIVIISTVRTDKIGFAKAIERINVAFSRAKRLLIVVGDKDFFAKNSDYRTSIQQMEVIGINQLS